jgi:hypothetical protein
VSAPWSEFSNRESRKSILKIEAGNGSFSHEYYTSSPSKTLRAAMGCSVRFAGIPGRAKERRIEKLTVNIAPRAAKPKKNPPG